MCTYKSLRCSSLRERGDSIAYLFAIGLVIEGIYPIYLCAQNCAHSVANICKPCKRKRQVLLECRVSDVDEENKHRTPVAIYIIFLVS